MKRALFFLAALAAFAGFGYTPVAYTNSFTRDGVTYVQRGALGTSDYVATNIDSYAVGKVQSVNSKTGDVFLDAKDVGAVPTNITEEVRVHLSEKLELLPNNSTNGIRFSVSGTGITASIDTNVNVLGLTPETVGALPDDYDKLTNNASFKNAVEEISPPTEFPEKWALANVTNNQGGTVGAINVSAFPMTAFIEEYTDSHSWSCGDYCLHDGQLWVAVDNTRAGQPWCEYRWEVSTDYTEPLKKWLNNRYIDLGQGGTNIWKSGQYVKRVALGSAYSKWWHMYLLPDYIGLESTDDSEYVRIKPSGYSFKYDGISSDISWRDVRTTANIVPMEASWFTPTRNDAITSPYYIHAYLTNHYWQTWEIDDKYLGKGDATRDYATYVALNSSNTAIRAEITTAGDNIKRLWNTDKTQYIDGDGYIWTQDPIHYAWSNQYGTVYNEYSGSSTTWVSPYDTRYKIVHIPIGFQYKYNDEIISQCPDIIPTKTVIQLQTQTGGDWVTFYKFNTGSITYSKTDEIVTTNNIASFMSGYVPETRTVNNKALSSNIMLFASDVGAVPTTRKINGQPLTSDLEISGMDYPAMTNTVNEVKAKFYDQPLQIEWTVRMVNGDMKLYATTNVNTSILNN